MSEIIAFCAIRGKNLTGKFWLILDCGHWYKWDGKRPKLDSEIPCPACNVPKVITDA